MIMYVFAILLSFNIIELFMHYLEDYAVSAIFMPVGEERDSTIIYFDECYRHESRTDITVVEYDMYDVKKTTFVMRGVKDNIGDKLSIITDGKIAVRKKVYKKYELESTAMVEMICVTISIWYLIKNCLSIDFITVLLFLLTSIGTILLHCIVYRLNWNKVKQLIGMHH